MEALNKNIVPFRKELDLTFVNIANQHAEEVAKEKAAMEYSASVKRRKLIYTISMKALAIVLIVVCICGCKSVPEDATGFMFGIVIGIVILVAKDLE
jgi:hypothetical protein